MRNLAIRQALIAPFGSSLILMLVGLTVPGYSSISEHMSKLGLLGSYPAVCEQVLSVVSGASIVVFSLALIRHPAGKFFLAAFTSAVFGISMLSNGVFPMGSPLHGLYGIGFFSALTPALFVAELNSNESTQAFSLASRLAAVITLFYLWLLITGFDPKDFRGLTQRLAVIPMAGWYSYASYRLLQSNKAASRSKDLQLAATT